MSDHDDDRHRWKVLGRETIYTSPWVNLHRDRVQLPDGSIIEGHHVVDMPHPAVAVVPVDAAGRVMLVYHDRFISGEIGWETPAGRLEAGETWEAAARRELWEETGCTGGTLQYLGRYWPMIGISNQVVALFLARDVQQTEAIQSTNEIIAARWFTVPEVRDLLARDAVPDGLTLTALLLAFYQGHLH